MGKSFDDIIKEVESVDEYQSYNYQNNQQNSEEDEPDYYNLQTDGDKLSTYKQTNENKNIDINNQYESNNIFDQQINQTIKKSDKDNFNSMNVDKFYNFDDDNDQNYLNQNQHQQQKLPDFDNQSQQQIEQNNYEKQYEDIDDSEDDNIDEINEETYIKTLKESLKKIFYFYAAFGKRISNDKINMTQFLKICMDSQIVDRKLDQQQIQIEFIRINKSQINMKYENFPKLLHSISQIKYDFGNPNENFKHLIEKNIMPLFNLVYNDTNMGTIDKIIKQDIKFATLMLIHLRKSYFINIYKKYFEAEIRRLILSNKEKVLKKSKQNLLKFFRDFELIPNLLSIDTVCDFYSAIINLDFDEDELKPIKNLNKIIEDDIGIVLTFKKFLFLLIKISIYIFSDPNNIPKKFRLMNFTSDEKFYMFLERIEISKGFFDLLIKKTKKNQNPRMTLLTKELADMHKETSAFPNFEEYLEGNENSSWMLLNFDIKVKNKRSNQLLFQKLNQKTQKIKSSKTPQKKKKLTYTFNPEFKKHIQPIKEDLRKIFNQYAQNQIGSNKSQMNCFKFIKFLKDTKIVQNFNPLDQTQPKEELTIMTKEADLIFTSLTHNNKKQRIYGFQKKPNYEKIQITNQIDFKAFLKSIEIIINKLFPDLPIQKGIDNLFIIKIQANLLQGQRKKRSNNDTQPLVTEKINQCNEYLRILSQYLEDQNVLYILENIHRYLSPRFYVYTRGKEYMDYTEFFEFYKDYGIFPDVLPKLKLEGIFDALNYIFQQNPEKSKKIQGEFIDEHIFNESVVLIGSTLKFKMEKEATIYQKITFLIDIMQESNGDKNLQNKNSTLKQIDVLTPIRNKHPEFFIIQFQNNKLIFIIMIIDWTEKLDGIGANAGTKQNIVLQSEVTEIIFDVLEKCNQIEQKLQKADSLKVDFIQATAQKQEQSLATDLSDLFSEINRIFQSCNKSIDIIRKEVTKGMKNDPEFNDPILWMKDRLSKSLQKKVYELIIISSKIQIEVKIQIEEKIARQLTLYDPNLKQDQIQSLIKQPEKVEQIVKQGKLQGANRKVMEAIDSIKDKLNDIYELEQSIDSLVRMIDDLSIIIKAQTELVNSIEQNMKGVKGFMGTMIENFQQAQKDYMSQQQKFCGIFVVLLILMIFGVQYAMGKLGIIQFNK